MNIQSLLRAARATIEKPEKWCQGEYARNALGQLDQPDNDTACSFCAEGAVLRAYSLENQKSAGAVDILHSAEARGFLRMALRERTELADSLSVFNDLPTTTHADIIALFDRAIELAEASQ